MDVHKKLNNIQVNVTLMNGDPLDIIMVCINSKINECFNKLIKELSRALFYDKLKEADVKILYNSIIIYSYYDQTIGDKYIKYLFENNIEIHEINVSLLFTDPFIYISNEIRLNFDTMRTFDITDGTTGCHEESYCNLSDSKKQKVDQILESLHSCSILDYYDIYNNIIKTKFIIGILLKNRIFNQYILLNQKNENFNNDKETIKILIKSWSGWFLQHASIELKANREIVEMAISTFGVSIQFASTELKENKELVIKAVYQDGRALQYVPNEFKGDREIVEIALLTYGYAIRYASTELKANRELAKKAVSQNGTAIRYLSNELQSDREIAKIAVSQNGNALEYLAIELQNDSEIVKIGIKQNPMAVKFASHELQCGDKEIFKIAFHIKGSSLYYASTELCADREIVELVVSKNGWELEYASRELRADREIVEIAVSNYGSSLQFASTELRADKDIIKTAINQYGRALEYASLESLRNDEELLELSYNKY